MSTIILPKTYKGEVEHLHGKPMVSWSQVETFIDTKGFNTGLLGKYEYIRKYFFGETYPDMGWGQFGNEAEAYITLRNKTPEELALVKQDAQNDLKEAIKNFTDKEKKVLETITPLGNFQTEVAIDFGKFVLLGYMDDHTDEFDHIRDYKTKSEGSKKGLTSDKTYQLELYGLYAEKMLGKSVKKYEYCIIERLGGGECMRGGGRPSLYVGERVWYEEKKINQARLKATEKLVLKTVKEISDYYKTFQKFNV